MIYFLRTIKKNSFRWGNVKSIWQEKELLQKESKWIKDTLDKMEYRFILVSKIFERQDQKILDNIKQKCMN
jgi:hypothetical protein